MHAGWAAQSAARRVDGARRISRAANGARRDARLLPCLRAVGAARLRSAARRARTDVADGRHRVQAVRMRYDDAAVHRLRDRAWPRRRARGGHRRDRVRSRRRAPCTGCGSRSPASTAPHALRGQIQHAVLHGGRVRRCARRDSPSSREAASRTPSCCTRREDPLRDQSERRLPSQLYRPPARHVERRRQREFRQPFMRGGAHAPLSTAEVEAKFMDNVALRRMEPRSPGDRCCGCRYDLFAQPQLDALAEFRS